MTRKATWKVNLSCVHMSLSGQDITLFSVLDSMPVTRIGSPPMIAASAYEWNTLLTTLLQAQAFTTKVVGRERKTVISGLDMSLYQPAKKLQKARNDLNHLVLRPVPFRVHRSRCKTAVLIDNRRICTGLASINEFEYDYAVVDGDPRSHGNRSSNGTATPIYQSLIKDPARDSVYSPLNREHDVPPEQQYTYNKVERPLYNPPRKGTPDPLYNVLDRPDDNGEDYIEPGVQIKKPNPKQAPQNNEPLYNVLEYPHQVGGKEAPQDEPDYSVLEDPNGIGGKEAPQEDEPDYNVLEDPDGDYDNAPVETDMRHPSSHDNVGYASTIDINSKQKPGTQRDPVYSVLEGPEGSLSEGTYQPLQIKAPDESVYQPLDRTSQIINDQPLYQVLEDKASMSNA
ncbi:hypothetical protein QZH41_003775 [Actinostola sp. cb2023]|nr:hypothetical protein QZH41_003775 [Actinostola sp. cb2023]